MSKKILLTISILISNRPDTVRKCLDSVQPLLKAVPSELILTDTGCGEQVRSIIEEYTNHIIDFKWCNDFSKARNAGLRQAKGKWFMFLDDDEWFEDTSDIIEFFNSGEYKKYGIGAYYQRNYANREGTLYSDLLVARMTQLVPEVKFVYSIHECFNMTVGRAKKFNAYVHHYGYLYNSPEERRAHAARNIVPLLKEHKANPRNMKHILQLVQEYSVNDEWEKSLEYSLKGIEIAQSGPVDDDFCLPSLYANVVSLYMEKWRYEAAIEAGEEYLQLKHIDPMAKAVIAGKLADGYMRTEKLEKSLEMAQFYWKVYLDFKKDEDAFIGYITNLTCSCFEPFNRCIALGNGVNAAILLGKDDIAWEWFQAMGIGEQVLYIEPEMAKAIAEKLPEKTGESLEHYTEMCNKLLENWERKDFLQNVIHVRCAQGETWEEKLRLAAAYGECKLDDAFMKIIKLAEAYGRQQAGEAYDQGETEQAAAFLWEHMAQNMQSMREYELLTLEEKLGIDVASLLRRIPFHVWQRELTVYYGKGSREDANWWTERLKAYLPEGERRMLLWCAFRGVYDAIKEADKESGTSTDVVLAGVREYVECRIHLCELTYRPEILANDQDVLPEEDQAAYKLLELQQQINGEEYAQAVKTVKVIKDLLPGLKPIIKWYLNWLSERMKEQEQKENQEKRRVEGEMQVLAVGVKLKIRQLVAAGSIQAALEVARQLSALLPGDRELQQQIKKLEAQLAGEEGQSAEEGQLSEKSEQ